MLIDPLAGHGRIERERHGVKMLRELDDETRVAQEQQRDVPATAIPRVYGSITDGTAMRRLLRALAAQNYIVDDTEKDPDPLPGTYYNNAGIRFRGLPPTSITGSGTLVLGTGFTLDFNDATDNSGRITLVTGTGIGAAGLIATIAFNRPKRDANYGVYLSAVDPSAGTAAGRSVYADFGDRTTTSWKISCAEQLANSTSYHWDYFIVERESL